MELELIYCTAWNYEPQAVSLATDLMTTYKRKIKFLKLIPSDGGRFEFSINGTLVYSKLKTGQFPKTEEIHKLLKQKIPA